MSLMNKALERRKQRGLDLTIIIGQPKKEEAPKHEEVLPMEAQEMEQEALAPKLEVEEESAQPSLQELMENENGKAVSPAEQEMPDMTSDMQDHEKESLLNGKPRSLMERAKLAQLKEKMKKG